VTDKLARYEAETIGERIFTIRSQKVILDFDLAAIYGVTTKRLNEQVKRNKKRFPADFLCQLKQDEWQDVQTQITIMDEVIFRSKIATGPAKNKNLRSQFATSSSHGGRRYTPYAFTEHGALMAANVLNSPSAVEMSVFVVRAFIKMREAFAGNKALVGKLSELEKKLTSRLNIHEKAIVHVLGEIKKLMATASQPQESQKRRIGFIAKEKRAAYAVK
jgi:hypothetical protein